MDMLMWGKVGFAAKSNPISLPLLFNTGDPELPPIPGTVISEWFSVI